MNTALPLALLGHISPDDFMRQYWQKKPLLIRAALADCNLLLSPAELFGLAQKEGVESRLIEQKKPKAGSVTPLWKMSHGPHAALPPAKRKDWTLLVQGVDLHHAASYALLQQFRFVPDARLDDVMVSYASEGGGVGPHFDSYDVFLLQTQGQRRWRIGAQKDLTLVEGAPLKILQNFKPTQDFVLNPGDMLYLPPRYAHDGVAVGTDCITYSIGFRAPSASEMARELLERLTDVVTDEMESSEPPTLYADPAQAATALPADLPDTMVDFAVSALKQSMQDPQLLRQLVGEALTEPKPSVWFEEGGKVPAKIQGVRLDPASRMLVDQHHVFLNGHSWRMAGQDAKLLRKLAHQRFLIATDLIAAKGLNTLASAEFDSILREWIAQGWLHAA